MALNFPPDPKEGDTHFDPSNGVTYTYKNGGWVASGGTQDDLDLRYVEVDGDNMTGNLTLGTDKITLNAENGSITAADEVNSYRFVTPNFTTSGGIGARLTTGSSTATCRLNHTVDATDSNESFVNYKGGTQNFKVQVDGSVKLGGTLPAAPNISLNAADGSSIFKNYVMSDSRDNSDITRRGRIALNPLGIDKVIYSQDSSSGSNITTFSVSKGGSGYFAGNIQSTSQNGAQIGGFRNQIINGDFRVWQRGIDFTAGSSGYCADRFFFSNASTPVQAKLTTTNLPVGFSYALQLNDTTLAIQQAIELFRAGQNNQFAKGSTWTMSVWSTIDLSSTPARLDWKTDIAATGTRAHAAVNYVSTGETSGDFTRYAATVIINSDAPAGSTMLSMVLTSASFKRFTGFQVEPGPVATPFENRPIGTELALCQRYFQVVTGTHGGGYGYNVARNSVSSLASTILATPMRAIPTATGGHVRFLDQTGTPGSNYVPTYTTTKDSIRISYSSASNAAYMIPADTAEIQWIDGGSSRFLDAEL